MATHKDSISYTQASGAGTSYNYLHLKDWAKFAAQVTISGTSTVTIEASCGSYNHSSDSDLASNLTWTDVTNTLIGSATITSSDIHIVDVDLPVEWVRFKIVGQAGSTTDITVAVMD